MAWSGGHFYILVWLSMLTKCTGYRLSTRYDHWRSGLSQVCSFRLRPVYSFRLRPGIVLGRTSPGILACRSTALLNSWTLEGGTMYEHFTVTFDLGTLFSVRSTLDFPLFATLDFPLFATLDFLLFVAKWKTRLLTKWKTRFLKVPMAAMLGTRIHTQNHTLWCNWCEYLIPGEMSALWDVTLEFDRPPDSRYGHLFLATVTTNGFSVLPLNSAPKDSANRIQAGRTELELDL